MLTGLEASAAGALGTTSLVVGGIALLALAFGLGRAGRIPSVVLSLLVAAVTFFFIAGEKLDLQQAYTWTTTVPSLTARQLTQPTSLQTLLNQFPAPNGPNLTFGLSELVGSQVVPSGLAAMNAKKWIFPRRIRFRRGRPICRGRIVWI